MKTDDTLTRQEIRDIVMRSHLHGDGAHEVGQFLSGNFSVSKVKENPVRQIYRLTPEAGGTGFYFKYFHRLEWYKLLLHFPPKIEYDTAKRVENSGIPMLPYAAWGRTPSGGFVFSREVEVVQARQYIFSSAMHSDALQRDFFQKLAALCRVLLAGRILHPDFHLGNILVRCKDSTLMLADPPGIRRVFHISNGLCMALLVPWREMFGIFPDDLIASYVVESGLCDRKEDAVVSLRYAMAQYRKKRLARYGKIRSQVLNGNSKYTRDFEENGNLYSFHHDLAFRFPPVLSIDPTWERRDFKGVATSEKLWIQSMLYQDCREMQPVLRVIYPDGNSSLYYADFRTYNL